MPFRATNTFQKCTSQGSCWSPGSQPGSDHKRKLFPCWSCRVAGRARGAHHCRAQGSLVTSCPLVYSFSWGPCWEYSGWQYLLARKVSFPMSPETRSGNVYTGLLLWLLQPARTLPWISLVFPLNTKKKVFLSIGARNHILPMPLRSDKWPQAKRRQRVCHAAGPSQTSFPADNLQIFIEGRLWTSSVPRSVGHTETSCVRQGAYVFFWEDQTDIQETRGEGSPVNPWAMLLMLGCMGRDGANTKTLVFEQLAVLLESWGRYRSTPILLLDFSSNSTKSTISSQGPLMSLALALLLLVFWFLIFSLI